MREITQVFLGADIQDTSGAKQMASCRNIPSGAYEAATCELHGLIPEEVSDSIDQLLL